MRKRRSTGFTVISLFIFAAAIVLSMLAVHFLPIPGKWKMLTFFTLIILLSFIGVVIAASVMKKR